MTRRTDKVTRMLSREVAEADVRKRATETANVLFTKHALDRMEERGIPAIDVYRILERGHVDQDPRTNEQGNWTCAVAMKLRGGREAAAVVELIGHGRIRVITVQWVDVHN